MATIKPFKAIRPDVKYVDKVASLPYDVMSTKEAKDIVRDNPYSFLQIDLPEVFLDDNQKEDNKVKYNYAKFHLDRLINDNILKQDNVKSYYIYQLENDFVSQKGIVGLASVEEYNNGTIKKHENTRNDKEIDRINHVEACNAHTGPIFLAYKSNTKLQNTISNYIQSNNSIYDFTASDGVRHSIWKVDVSTGNLISAQMQLIDSLYIADGHHRSAAAAAIYNKRQTNKSKYFLSVSFDEDDLLIMDYNRVVKDLNNMSSNEFLQKVSKKFNVKKVKDIHKPNKKYNFGMYYNENWYSLSAKDDMIKNDSVLSLDVSILQNNLLNPILNIKEPRVDTRIEFIGGIRGLKYLEDEVEKYNGVGFSMFPTSIEELMDVADDNKLMPPKSTWFEPKLLSGIFINSLD